ncbi:sulfatase-like hydrolase/transferase [Escherichia coli]
MPGRGSMNFDNNSLLNPAKKFTYQAPQNVDDTYVVFIIGETTRWDHMGIFGDERNTTPKLAQEKNLAAFRGYSCDTATGSTALHVCTSGGRGRQPQRTLKEQNIFAVLKQLGFSSNLHAMQSECGSTATRWRATLLIVSRLVRSHVTWQAGR